MRSALNVVNARAGRDGRPPARAPAARDPRSRRASLSLAPRLASTSARAAAPSRARRTGSVSSAPAGGAPDRDPTAPGRPRHSPRTSRRSPEVLHVGAEMIGLPKIAGSRILCRRDRQGCRRRTPRWPPDSCASSPIESSTTTSARLRIDLQLGSANGDESGPRAALDLAEPFGGAVAPGSRARRGTHFDAPERAQHRVSPRMVLPATTTCRWTPSGRTATPLAQLAVGRRRRKLQRIELSGCRGDGGRARRIPRRDRSAAAPIHRSACRIDRRRRAPAGKTAGRADTAGRIATRCGR